MLKIQLGYGEDLPVFITLAVSTPTERAWPDIAGATEYDLDLIEQALAVGTTHTGHPLPQQCTASELASCVMSARSLRPTEPKIIEGQDLLAPPMPLPAMSARAEPEA